MTKHVITNNLSLRDALQQMNDRKVKFLVVTDGNGKVVYTHFFKIGIFKGCKQLIVRFIILSFCRFHNRMRLIMRANDRCFASRIIRAPGINCRFVCVGIFI